jgi:hypothetical protein
VGADEVGLQQLPPSTTTTTTRWVCRLKDGSSHTTSRVVVCTGGLSFPAVGTDGTGHRLLAQLGVPLSPTYPALTPLQGPHPGGAQLAGLSQYSVQLSVHGIKGAKRPRAALRTGLLFTHRGFSGPAILDLAHTLIRSRQVGDTSVAMRVNWTSDAAVVWEERLRVGGTALVATGLQRGGVRERLADALCAELGLSHTRLCELRREDREALISALTAYELQYAGNEGYKKAEVTGGGVPLTQVRANCLGGGFLSLKVSLYLFPSLFTCFDTHTGMLCVRVYCTGVHADTGGEGPTRALCGW